jgi:hypothetical protein
MANAERALLRSYRSNSFPDTKCTIWEAIRATTAFPLLFKHILIGENKYRMMAYSGGELLASNPIKTLIQEYDLMYAAAYSQSPPHGCIVSIGAGQRDVVSLADYHIDDVNAKEKLFKVLKDMATSCENEHRNFGSGLPHNMTDIYFRFNVEQGLQKIADEQWHLDQNVTSQTYQYVISPFSYLP